MTQVKNNYLEDSIFANIKKLLFSFDIPWYFYENATDKSDDENARDFFYCHMLYDDDQIKSNFFNAIALPILGKLTFSKIIRIKINMYTANPQIIIQKPNYHVDFKYPHRVALLNVNSNNGYTEFENGEKIVSEANQLLEFDGQNKHRAISQTDTDVRINININYL